MIHSPKRLIALLSVLLVVVLGAGCDSTNAIATVTARANGTNTASAVLSPTAPAPPTSAPTTPPALSTAASGAGTQAATSAPTAAPTSAAPSVGTTASTAAPTTAVTQASTSAPTLAATASATPPATMAPTSAATQSALAQPGISPAAATSPVLTRDTSWFSNATLYSLFVRSFRDSNGDGIGDLQGVIDGLDYLQSLGVDTVWLLPIFKSPTYHGYDTTDYDTVNPDYGTNDDLLRLIKEMHRRKMHLLLDYVIDHTSDKHPYFVDARGNPNSQYSDYYLWGNDAHTTYSFFGSDEHMPRLNFDSPKVRQFATEIALHWLDPLNNGDLSAGVDGFRCDVAKDVPTSFWHELRAAMTAKNPQSLLLGELWYDAPQDMRPFLSGDRLDAAFNFPLYLKMAGAFDKNGEGVFSGKGLAGIAFGLVRYPERFYPDGAQIVQFINNHDTNRVMSNVGGDPKRAKAAAVFELTLAGTPMLYYGEEIGMKGSAGPPPHTDEYRREPFGWTASLTGKGQTTWFAPPDRNNPPNSGASVEEQDGKPDSLLTLYRALGTLRRDHPALRTGKSELVEGTGDLYLLRRWDAKDLFVIAINFSEQPIRTTPDSKTWTTGTVTAKKTYTPAAPLLSQGFTSDGGTWTLEPGGFVVVQAQ